MSRTSYSLDNQNFSDLAHAQAKIQIYPKIFPSCNLKVISTSLAMGEKERILDGEMAIDRIVEVSTKSLKASMEFTVQERFRRDKFRKFHDMTITEWNNSSQMKSELYKLNAQLFVYGYFNGEVITEWVAVDTTKLLHGIAIESIAYKKGFNPRSKQDFITLPFSSLNESGCLVKTGVFSPNK